MSNVLKLRGGTAAQHASFTGASREVTVDDDDHTLRVHDGVTPGGWTVQGPLSQRLLQWAYTNAFQLVSATRDTSGVLLTGNIAWPDGATGGWTTDSQDPTSGAINSWHATYVNGATTKTVTQPAVTRDANGAVTVQPAITIA